VNAWSRSASRSGSNKTSLAFWLANVACHIHKGKFYEARKVILNASDKSLGELVLPQNREVERIQNGNIPEVGMKQHQEVLRPPSH
jgi:hypothetical protein